ncbi:helix-turn-helix domain-containing protein [Sphaerisporangium sp. NPDC004334]
MIDEMRRGRDQTARSMQELATQMYASKATISRWLAGKAQPTREQAQQWAELCGTDPDLIGNLWDDAHNAAAPLEPSEPLVRVESAPAAARRRRWAAPLAILATVVVAAAGGAIWWTSNRNDQPTPVCAGKATGPAMVQPTPDHAAGVTFCPVEINEGRLPITGPFRLSGQVLGPLTIRQRMVLLVSSDPNTCDALGNAAPDARMYLHEAQIGSSDGSWSYIDTLGYEEAVTYARNFVYVLAPSNDVLNEIYNDRDHYLANGGDEGSYAGLTRLPAGAEILAHFDVPAGLYHGKPGTCHK